MSFPKELKYSKTHQWIRVEDKTSTIGISDYAQQELKEIVFVDLPEVGTTVEKGEVFGSIESAKTVSDLYSPVDGEVKERNEELDERPKLVNEDPYGKGWMIKVEMTDLSQLDELLSAHDYEESLKEE
jgi:glycine cleavage system H protein